MVSSSVRMVGLPGAAQLDDQLGAGPAAPAQAQLGSPVLSVDVDAYLFDQCAQEFLAVPVGDGGRRPHRPMSAPSAAEPSARRR
jgi:hypothetical protein